MTNEFDYLLGHWQSHRRLTRRTIEAFPPDALFAFAPAGGMRPFAEMMGEVLGMYAATLHGIASGDFQPKLEKAEFGNKRALLEAWDAATARIDEMWAQVPPERFRHEEAVFGFPRQPLIGLVHYLIDNEVHHRGQGYVYLRMLEVEPPPFYVR